MIQITNNIPKISIEGFQIVSGEMFVHLTKKSEPTCTIWYDSITFSKAALDALNNCERVRIELNPKTKCLLLVPVTSKDKDGIQWTNGLKKMKARKIGCKAFTSQLYETWKWEYNSVHRASGRIVSADKKIMLLFDFNDSENWKRKENTKGKQYE